MLRIIDLKSAWLSDSTNPYFVNTNCAILLVFDLLQSSIHDYQNPERERERGDNGLFIIQVPKVL